MALIKRKKGKINGAVYDNTVYHNGERRFYLPVYELHGLLQKIAEANETTEFLRLIPHYLYKKGEKNLHVEFDGMMFFALCESGVTEERKERFYKECAEEDEDALIITSKKNVTLFEERHDAALSGGDIENRFCLCEKGDTKAFSDAVGRYADYLKILIPRMREIIVRNYNIAEEDLLFGYICFEADSG